MANTLFLRLEGPLQAWGENSQWSERRTAPEPTKSGIVGMLACALGWKDDGRIAALSRAVQIGVRCDVIGTAAPLRDYHTVGGGYAHPQLLTATGEAKWTQKPNKREGTKGRPHTELTWRYYLCDASFLVAVRADDETISQLAHAVQFPVWPLFLGRKSCVPTRPPFDEVGDYESIADALENHPARFFQDEYSGALEAYPRMVIESSAGKGVRRRDQLVSRTYRIFEPRYAFEMKKETLLQVSWIKEE